MVLEWTSGMGVDLMAGVPGPQGLTALHVAAVMGDGASLAALLTGQAVAFVVISHAFGAVILHHLYLGEEWHSVHLDSVY